MNLVANNSPLSTDTLNEALDLAASAVDAVGVVQSKSSNASSSVERASAAQSDYQSFAETLGSDLTSVDVAAVTAQLSTYQAQLTASYAAIAKVQSLELSALNTRLICPLLSGPLWKSAVHKCDFANSM